MKSLQSYRILLPLLIGFLVAACQSEESPCPGISLEVDVDSANQSATLFASDLEGLEYQVFINGTLIEEDSLGGSTDFLFDLAFEPGEYEVCVKAQPNQCDTRIEACIEFEIKSAEACLDLHFETVKINENYYKFYADSGILDNIPYKWYVNGDLVKEEPLSEERTNYLAKQLGPGEYEICIVASTDACDEAIYCETIVVEGHEGCAEEVYFEIEKDNNYTYYFYASFSEKTFTDYKWYINDELVDIEVPSEGDADHKLYWQFDVGTYSVCLITDEEGCDPVEWCETIVVEEEVCHDLSFTSELTQTDTTDFYTFTADFEGRDDVTYIWKVFINDDFQGQEVRIAGSDDDHLFFWHMEPGVEYEICLKQDGCSETQVCEVLAVD